MPTAPASFAENPGCRRRSSYLRVRRLLCGPLEELLCPSIHFFARDILFPGRDRPLVPVRIGEGSAPIAPELIGELAHRAGGDLRARRDGAVEQRVAVLHV